MSAPTSSSHPPSFSSFPDIDPGPSSTQSQSNAGGSHRDKSKKRDSYKLDDEKLRTFYSDRKGDPLNVTYGSIHSGQIPKYHLVSGESKSRLVSTSNEGQGGREVLGLSKEWSAHRRTGKGVEVDINGSGTRVGVQFFVCSHLHVYALYRCRR
jgi:hypothetical protein